MIKKFFGKNDPASEPAAQAGEPQTAASDIHPARMAMINAAKNIRAESPIKALRIAAQELEANLLNVLKDARGIHIETAIGALGSLAGFWSLMAAFSRVKNDPSLIEGDQNKENFLQIGTADGQTFYFGNLINVPLLESEHSVWGLTAGMAQHIGATELPDVTAIIKHVSASVGTPEFGQPRLPDAHGLSASPEHLVVQLKDWALGLVHPYIESADELPIVAGLAIQNLMEKGKGVLPPSIAAQIVMECAVPMSKIDPRRIDAQVKPAASPSNG